MEDVADQALEWPPEPPRPFGTGVARFDRDLGAIVIDCPERVASSRQTLSLIHI